MDFRQFFEGFIRLNEELGSFFEQPMFNGREDDGFFLERNPGEHHQQGAPGQSPRDMMLKRPESRDDHHQHPQQHRREDGFSLMDLLESGENFFRSSQFEKTFSGDLGGGSGMFEEKIVIRNGDGTEKVITKHSSGGRTTHREITRRGGQIISEREVVSDIGGKFASVV